MALPSAYAAPHLHFFPFFRRRSGRFHSIFSSILRLAMEEARLACIWVYLIARQTCFLFRRDVFGHALDFALDVLFFYLDIFLFCPTSITTATL